MLSATPPSFFCPIEPVLHPDVDLVEQRAIEWSRRFDLSGERVSLAKLVGTNSAEFFARITPRAPVERLQPAVNWCYWAFGYDDAHSDGPGNARAARAVRTAARVLRVTEAWPPYPPRDDQFLTALADIATQLHELATDTQLRRWRTAQRGWLAGTVWEAGNDETDTPLDLADYLTMRLSTCGGEPTTAMIEIANGAEVPASGMDAPRVIALSEAAWLVGALDNDLISFAREARLGQAGQNVVSAIAREEGCTAEQARRRATALRDRVMVLFLRLRERLPATASQELREYVDCLASMIRGNLDWSLRVPRYQQVSETHPDTHAQAAMPSWTEPSWTDRPSDPDPSPIPVPGLAWWWDQL